MVSSISNEGSIGGMKMQQLFDELYEQISDKEALFTYLCALKMQENACNQGPAVEIRETEN